MLSKSTLLFSSALLCTNFAFAFDEEHKEIAPITQSKKMGKKEENKKKSPPSE